jgi:DNA-binding GntR family transcriptional regulator
MNSSTKKSHQNHLELVQRIVEQIQTYSLSVGDRLYEQSLASACNVSRTPIRAALALLEQHGIVNRRETGGFSLAVNSSIISLAQESLPKSPEATLYDQILRDRTAHRLEETVTIAGLIRRYQCSRQAVQNVLKNLSDEQLVERAPGQRWLFRPALNDHEALIESYRFRLNMEPTALLEPNFKLDTLRVSTLRTKMQTLLDTADQDFDPALFFDTDFEFHETLARGCGNRFFSDVLLHHLRLRRLPQITNHPSAFRLKSSTREHLAILDHLEAGRVETASDTMRLHLRLSADQRPNIANWGAPAGVGIRYPLDSH